MREKFNPLIKSCGTRTDPAAAMLRHNPPFNYRTTFDKGKTINQ
jgi:hypothetical protein